MRKSVLAILIVVALSGCTGNVKELKYNGARYLETMNWKVLGYEGYQVGIWGGKVWFLVCDPAVPNVRYSVYLIKRDGEYHLYRTSKPEWNDNKSIQIDKK